MIVESSSWMKRLVHMFPKVLLLSLALIPLQIHAQAPAPEKPAKPLAYDNPSATDEDFPFQGEYVGEVDGAKLGVQIIALGRGEFEAVGYPGGLPGAGWDGDRAKIVRSKGQRADDAVSVRFEHNDVIGEVDGVKIHVSKKDAGAVAELERVDRRSPTLGAAPPEGAVVLFDGKENKFPGAKVTPDGLLTQGATSSEKFGDCSIHIEFRLPYMPSARGQGRGNSGLYVQGRYEIQMLDSFGLEGKDNECGGLYKIAAPKLNMCFSPLTWQTYDIDFTAAKFNAEGKKTSNARLTVKLNGVAIHENLELPGTTGGAQLKETAEPGPFHLQNHGNPVRYRNIWAVRK
jgi:hypothetical protein